MSIEVVDLTVERGQRVVLDRVAFEIAQSSFTVVLGRNGSGKSTLFQVLAGSLRPREGSVRLLGRDAVSLKPRDRARILGYLPQFHRPVFPFRVFDVVLTGRAGRVLIAPSAKDHAKAEEAMHDAGVESLRDRVFTELSGGEQQMVMIARLLAQEPQIVLMDEPTSHLDFHYQAHVLALIRRMTAKGITVFASLHDPNIALNCADRILLLEGGRVRALLPENVGVHDLEKIYHVALHSLEDHEMRFVSVGRPRKKACS